jgi:hypothetical protein
MGATCLRLVFFVSRELMQSRGSAELIPLPTHSYDTGAASGYFALQAQLMGWHVHGMYGFDHVRSAELLRTPLHHHVEAAYAVGRIGDASALPEALQVREVPGGRLSLAELVHEGSF